MPIITLLCLFFFFINKKGREDRYLTVFSFLSKMNSFPSNNELDSQMIKSSSYIKWKDLPLFIWYKIVSSKEIDTNIGTALILHLADRSGDTLDVFATSLIQKEIENCSGTLYIKSTGKQDGKKYYSFDLVSK